MQTKNQEDETIFLYGYDIKVRRGPLRDGDNQPDTVTPILMCDEVCERPSLHRFIGRRQIIKQNTGEIIHEEIVYACRSCGNQRVWGTEDTALDAEEVKIPEKNS